MQRPVLIALVVSAIGVVPVNAEPLSSAHADPGWSPAQEAMPFAGPQQNLGGGLIEFIFSDAPRGAQRPSAAGGATRADRAPAASTPWMEPQGGYAAYAPEPAHPGMDPRYERQLVEYEGSEGAGTIVIDTRERFLYLVEAGHRALRYGIGVGRPGFAWSGIKRISMKREWPDWVPPDDMLKRRPDLPRYMPGGPENPLGARAMYLGSSLYRIHGSNEPWTIGKRCRRAASACATRTSSTSTAASMSAPRWW